MTTQKRADRAGIRWFKCHDCGDAWSETTRDAYSPSSVACPTCNDLTEPMAYIAVPGVYYNRFGGVDPNEVRKQYRLMKGKGNETT